MDFTISQQIHMDSNGFMLNCSDYIKWTLKQHQNKIHMELHGLMVNYSHFKWTLWGYNKCTCTYMVLCWTLTIVNGLTWSYVEL
jgi:uncharacterized protein (UPF0371 family)